MVRDGMHEALWVVIIAGGICVLLFALDVFDLLALLFKSSGKK